MQGDVEPVEKVRARVEEGDFLGLTVCGDDIRGHLCRKRRIMTTGQDTTM